MQILSELEKNYFELFGLPEQFLIDLSGLADRYRQLQKQFHPDKFASGSDAERRVASQVAAQINTGYQVLKSPLERGRCLLSLSDIKLDDENDTNMNPEFLMEQMELRESLESAQSASEPLKALADVVKEVQSGINKRIELLAELFIERESHELLNARNVLREMQFLEKTMKNIEQLEDELI